MPIVRKRVVVHGRVQGVYFRDSVRRLADRHAIAGWVRNTWDGSVEAVFEGAEADVSSLVAYVHEGPRGARVERVEIHDEEAEGLSGFRVTG